MILNVSIGVTELFLHTSNEISTFWGTRLPDTLPDTLPDHLPAPLKKCIISFMKLSQIRHFLARCSPTPF